MTHKKALEAVSTSLQDLRDCEDKPMGGLLLVCTGDFRQCLPVIPRGTLADQMNASLQRSYLWANVLKVTLTINMRVQLSNDPMAHQFADEILKIGNGRLRGDRYGAISIPADVANHVNSVEELVSKVFPDLGLNYAEEGWFTGRAILAPLNDNVDKVNMICLIMVPGNNLTNSTTKSLQKPIFFRRNHPLLFDG